MSSIYELIYGPGATAASQSASGSASGAQAGGEGGAGHDDNATGDDGAGQHVGGSGSTNSRRKRPHPDGEYAFDPVGNFYDTGRRTAGLGQSVQEANPLLSSSLLQQQTGGGGGLLLGQLSQQSSDGGLSGFSSAEDPVSPDKVQPNRTLLLDSDDEDYLDATASDTSAGGSLRRRSKRRRSSLLDMTPERLERKRKKRARERRRRRFRYGKKWDLAEEVDYGDAVKTMMRRLMDQRKAKRHNKKKDGEQSSNDESDEDDDNDQMPGVLDGLLKHMSQDEDPVTTKMESDGEYHTDRSSGGRTDDDADNDDDDDAANKGPMSYLKQGHSAPLRNADMEYSYTRDAPAPPRRGIGPGINRTDLPLHSNNPAVARVIPPYSHRARTRGLVDPFFYFPLMSRHGHLSGREGLESTRGHLSRILPSSYLPPRSNANSDGGIIVRESKAKKSFPKKAQKAQNGVQEIKMDPKVRVNPRADELHLFQLRKLAASMITGATGTRPSHREALFRIISLLHSSIGGSDESGQIQSSRDRIILQYAREVESNRELWRRIRVDVMVKLRRLQRDDMTGGRGSKRPELEAFCSDVMDIMDELLGDEPSWMCGPNAIWETNPIRERAKKLRNRIERLFPSPEARADGLGYGSAAAGVDGDDKEIEEGQKTDDGRKVRFTMDESDSDRETTDGEEERQDENNHDKDESPPVLVPNPRPGVIRNSARRSGAADGDKNEEEVGYQPDPYALMQRGNAQIDPTVVCITLAALVSELCAARSQAEKKQLQAKGIKNEESTGYQGMSALSISNGRSIGQDCVTFEEQADELKQALVNYFDHVIKSFPIFHQRKDIPDPNLATIALRRQSFVANDHSPALYLYDTKTNDADLETKKTNDRVDSSDNDSIDEGRPTATSTSILNDKSEGGWKVDITSVAEDIANAGRKLQADPRLKFFTELHITTVIASFAAVLPPNAAEIISRPCSLDDVWHRTPFDLMKLMLEDMESKQQIHHEESIANALSSFGDQQPSIKSPALISELLTAAEAASDLAEKAKHTDPTIISWQLAFLAGATCVSSGIVIGTGAQWAASDYYEDHGEIARRTRADNHAEVRLQTAKCLRNLLEMCDSKHNPGDRTPPSYCVAASSFLEWKEATCLLIRRGARGSNEQHFRGIRMLHAYYSIEWAISDRSDIAVKRILDLNSSGEVSNDVLSMVLADRLEQAPDDGLRWMHLASSLGSLGEPSDSQKNQDNFCSVEECTECPYLQERVCCDHDALSRRKQDEGWWGYGRKWWDQLFFHFSSPSRKSSGESSCSRTLLANALDESIRADGTSYIESAIQENVYQSRSRGGVGPRHQNLDLDPTWLATPESEAEFYYSSSSSEDEGDDPSLPRGKHVHKKSKVFDDLLPKHISNVCSGVDVGSISKELPNTLEDAMSEFDSSYSSAESSVSVLCCKILVASHLLGPSHKFISDGVNSLASSCPRDIIESNGRRGIPDNTSNSEYLGLLWLSKQGLNVQKILRDAEKYPNGSSSLALSTIEF